MNTSRTRGFAVAAAAAMVLSVPGTAYAETFKVNAKDNDRWGPVHTYIGKGDKVIWRNYTNRRHDVRSIGGNWSYFRDLPRDTKVGRFFNKTGTFRYRCARHSAMVDKKCQGMCGVIHVFSG